MKHLEIFLFFCPYFQFSCVLSSCSLKISIHTFNLYILVLLVFQTPYLLFHNFKISKSSGYFASSRIVSKSFSRQGFLFVIPIELTEAGTGTFDEDSFDGRDWSFPSKRKCRLLVLRNFTFHNEFINIVIV